MPSQRISPTLPRTSTWLCHGQCVTSLRNLLGEFGFDCFNKVELTKAVAYMGKDWTDIGNAIIPKYDHMISDIFFTLMVDGRFISLLYSSVSMSLGYYAAPGGIAWPQELQYIEMFAGEANCWRAVTTAFPAARVDVNYFKPTPATKEAMQQNPMDFLSSPGFATFECITKFQKLVKQHAFL